METLAVYKITNDNLRISLILHYTSIQFYHLLQKDFKMPSLSVISKLKPEGIYNAKALKFLEAQAVPPKTLCFHSIKCICSSVTKIQEEKRKVLTLVQTYSLAKFATRLMV